MRQQQVRLAVVDLLAVLAQHQEYIDVVARHHAVAHADHLIDGDRHRALPGRDLQRQPRRQLRTDQRHTDADRHDGLAAHHLVHLGEGIGRIDRQRFDADLVRRDGLARLQRLDGHHHRVQRLAVLVLLRRGGHRLAMRVLPRHHAEHDGEQQQRGGDDLEMFAGHLGDP